MTEVETAAGQLSAKEQRGVVREAWRAAVHAVAQGRTQLSDRTELN